MRFTYSVMGSPLHIVLEEALATQYNQAVDGFVKAQSDHKDAYGIRWDPNRPIQTDSVGWTAEERGAWNRFTQAVDLLIRTNGGELDVYRKDVTSDYLIKV